MKLFLAILGVCILGAHALSQSAKIDIPTSDDEPVPRISMARSTCFGTCPAYTLKIYGDGRVVFTGKNFVKSRGTHTSKIDPADFQRLMKKAEEIGFWDMNDSYRHVKNPDGSISMVTDLPTTLVTITTATRTKKVLDYYGTPESLKEFEALIDEVTNTQQWIGDRNDPERLRNN